MLRVYALSGQELITMEAENGSIDIASLKTKLQSRHGFPVEKQELLHENIAVVNDMIRLPVEPGTKVDLQLVLLPIAKSSLRERQEASNKLRYAFETGDLNVARRLLQAGVDTNMPDAGGHTALMRAAEEGNRETAKLLLEAGARANWATANGTALILAAQKGHTEMLQLLLEAGAGTDVQDDFGDTALISAARSGHMAAVQLWVDAGANTELTNLYRDAALKYAAETGHLSIVEVFLRAGANKDLQDCCSMTALTRQRRAESRLCKCFWKLLLTRTWRTTGA